MTLGQQNAPRSESLGAYTDEFPLVSTDSTPCEHLAEAAKWLAQAERSWGQDAALSEAAARIAQLHIELADRVELLEACDE